jgi:hypothetical protein
MTEDVQRLAVLPNLPSQKRLPPQGGIYKRPAARAQRYLAPSTATGFSVVYGYARMLCSIR